MLSAINYVLFNRTASKHVELADPPLFWPVNCIKYSGNKLHDRVALLFLPCSVCKMLELLVRNCLRKPRKKEIEKTSGMHGCFN